MMESIPIEQVKEGWYWVKCRDTENNRPVYLRESDRIKIDVIAPVLSAEICRAIQDGDKVVVDRVDLEEAVYLLKRENINDDWKCLATILGIDVR